MDVRCLHNASADYTPVPIKYVVRARFSAPVQSGPGTHTASCSMGTGSVPGVKRPGRGVNQPISKMVRVKLSRYRPGQALGVPGAWGSRISRQSAHECGKVVSPTLRPSLPQEGLLVLISVRSWIDPRATMRPEGLSNWKIPVTPSGIEPATFHPI
jgi:hypothetical protein